MEALEEDDFPGALNYLKWAADPLLAQILVLRLRLLAAKHDRQRQAIQELLEAEARLPAWCTGWKPALPEKYQDLLQAEDQALGLLGEYEAKALAGYRYPRRRSKSVTIRFMGPNHPLERDSLIWRGIFILKKIAQYK